MHGLTTQKKLTHFREQFERPGPCWDIITFPISSDVLFLTDHCQKLLTFYMFMFNSNEPIKAAHPQKLANQSLAIEWRTCVGNGKQFL